MTDDACAPHAPPVLKRVWDSESLAKLRVAWEAGGVNTAHQAFPDKTKKALEQAAYQHGIRRLSSPARKLQEAVQVRAPNLEAAIAALDDQDAYLEKRLSAIETRLATIESALRRQPIKAAPEPAKVDAAPGMTLASVEPRPAKLEVVAEAPPLAAAPPTNPEAKQQAGRLEPIKPGPCDPGDREFIRRRMDFTIFGLSADLRRSQASIRDAIADLARGNYEPQGVARINMSREVAEGSIEDISAATPRKGKSC